MFPFHFFPLNLVLEALGWEMVPGSVWRQVLLILDNSKKCVERIIGIHCKVVEEGNISWDRETTGAAQSGSEICPDVCYHVRVQGSWTPGSDKLGQGEGFSPFRWKDGSRKRCIISTLLPVWSERKLGTCCAACCQDGVEQAGERGRWDSPEGVVESSHSSSQYGQTVWDSRPQSLLVASREGFRRTSPLIFSACKTR